MLIFSFIMSNLSARYLNPVKNPKFIQNRYLKALLIIPTKKRISTKGITFYIMELILLIIVSLSYACGFMMIDVVYRIMECLFWIITFIALGITGAGDKMNY